MLSPSILWAVLPEINKWWWWWWWWFRNLGDISRCQLNDRWLYI